VLVQNLSTGWNRKLNVCGIRAIAMPALAWAPVRSSTMRTVLVFQQRRHIRVDDQDHVSPATTVATIGPTEGLELLAQNRRTPVAAVTACSVYDNAINEGRHATTSTNTRLMNACLMNACLVRAS